MEKDNYILRGFYRPSFFTVFINGEFSANYAEIPKTDLGTFVHEYIHYLQNITTSFGLRNSIFYFNYLYEVKKYIAENDEIELPLKEIPFTDVIKNGQSRFSLCNGTSRAFSPQFDDIKILVKRQEKGNVSVNSVYIELYSTDSLVETVIFGNNCVKESMALLFQQLFDDEASSFQFPYHSAELICKKINPELLQDKRKVISLCLVALNSQNCGLTFFELVHKSLEDKELNGIELYQKYLTELRVQNAHRNISIQEFLLESIGRFKEVLSASLVTDLKHFNLLMDNIELVATKNILPLIEVLYEDEKSNVEKLTSLIDFYGIPHIRTINGYNYYPMDIETQQPALEFTELIGQRIVLDRLLGIDDDQIGKTCSFRPQCELSEEDIIDDNCYETQWKREIACPFKIISDSWKLNEKIKAGNNVQK